MQYLCTKACNLGGVAYVAGDTIPSEAVLPSRAPTLAKMGFIVQVDGVQDKAVQETAMAARKPAEGRRRPPSRKGKNDG